MHVNTCMRNRWCIGQRCGVYITQRQELMKPSCELPLEQDQEGQGYEWCLHRMPWSSLMMPCVVVPGPRSRSYRIVLRYTTRCTLQSVVSS